jgi:hypothetical protein
MSILNPGGSLTVSRRISALAVEIERPKNKITRKSGKM